MPSFSVVVTTHDRANLLGRAIRSAKEQDGVDVQVIVVADRACAATQAVASAHLDGDDLFVQRAGVPGPAESRNIGIALANRDNVVFLDDDDALSPAFLRRAAEHADGRTVLYADFTVVLERLDDGVPVALGAERRSLAGIPIDSVHAKNFIPAPCLVYPRAALAGRRFDPSLALNEDWEFILSVMEVAPLRHVGIDGPVVHSRVQADNRGRTNDHLLLPTYLTVYANRPAPTPETRAARRGLMASIGFDAGAIAM